MNDHVPLPDEPDEREDVLFHGTTLDVAQIILARKCFDLRKTWFAGTRPLAAYFATRTCKKRSNASEPVLIRVVVYESDLAQWKKGKHVQSVPFDEGDCSELYGKTQLIFSAEGIRLLNRFMFPGDLSIEPVHFIP